MKTRISSYEVEKMYDRIISIGYCNAQFLLRVIDPLYYSTRPEGWACDYYEIPRNILVSTGYSPIGKHVEYDLIKIYDDAARRIWENPTMDYESQKAKALGILADFAGDIEAKLFPELLPGQLYEPEVGKYNLPIFANDNAISAYTWQYLIDTYVANNGHDVTETKFRRHIREFLKMIEEDVFDTFDLCKKQIIKEVKNDE